MEIRKLRADEIDCRIQSITAKGLRLLLYKDARCDMRILDEVFGAMNWKREHSRDNANCTVSVWDESKQQWISKEDTGTESNTEAEKGLASDSFKRACVNWGIGRELYSSPSIWIYAEDCNIKSNDSRKYVCYDRFKVTEIGYDKDGNIDKLIIVNVNTGRKAFTFGGAQERTTTEDSGTALKVKQANLQRMLKQIHQSDKNFWNDICAMFSISRVSDADEKTCDEISHLAAERIKHMESAE